MMSDHHDDDLHGIEVNKDPSGDSTSIGHHNNNIVEVVGSVVVE
jgi:hypothetical protein